jgi:hypothetical protein
MDLKELFQKNRMLLGSSSIKGGYIDMEKRQKIKKLQLKIKAALERHST